jgi:hypothetical protein
MWNSTLKRQKGLFIGLVGKIKADINIRFKYN